MKPWHLVVAAVVLLALGAAMGHWSAGGSVAVAVEAANEMEQLARENAAAATAAKAQLYSHVKADSIEGAAATDSTAARALRASERQKEQENALRAAEATAEQLEARLDAVGDSLFRDYKAGRDLQEASIKADLAEMTADRDTWERVAERRGVLLGRARQVIADFEESTRQALIAADLKDSIIRSQAKENTILKLVGGGVVVLTAARELGIISR